MPENYNLTTAQALDILQGHFTTMEGLRKHIRKNYPKAIKVLTRLERTTHARFMFSGKMINKIKKIMDKESEKWTTIEAAGKEWKISPAILKKSMEHHNYKKKVAPGRGIVQYKKTDVQEAIDLDEL